MPDTWTSPGSSSTAGRGLGVADALSSVPGSGILAMRPRHMVDVTPTR